jgi:hypothetical protein
MENDFSRLRHFCSRVWERYREGHYYDNPNNKFEQTANFGMYKVTVDIQAYPNDNAYGVIISIEDKYKFGGCDAYIQQDFTYADSRLERKIFNMLCGMSFDGVGGGIDGIS